MSGVIAVIDRLIGTGDISWGQNSFVYIDAGGVARRQGQVNAGDMPFESYADAYVQNLVDGSKNLPVGASQLNVLNTSIFSGPVYMTGAASGYVKNYASGLLMFGQGIATADIPSGIPASSIGSGTVNDEEFGYLNNISSNIQGQINALSSTLGGVNRLQYFQPEQAASLVYVGTGTAKVPAWASNTAMVVMDGIPNVMNPKQFVTGGLTNGKFYQSGADVVFYLATNLYGTEKVSQMYAVFAMCDTATAELDAFVLKAMPYIRVLSHAGQVISAGTNLNPAVAIDYGFTVNDFINGKVYVISGPSAGELRTITANSAAAGSSTVSYSGAALTLNAGDVVLVLPPGQNFRWLGDVWNDVGGSFYLIQELVPRHFPTYIYSQRLFVNPCNRSALILSMAGGGGPGTAGTIGGDAQQKNRTVISVVPSSSYVVAAGTGGTAGVGDGGTSYFTGLAQVIGGVAGSSAELTAYLVSEYYGRGGSAGLDGKPGIIIVE